MADRFRFGRGPIRDALRVFEEEGLIERRKKRESDCTGPKNYYNRTSEEGDNF
ncbi:MAG: GntR family transcriptional regulator [Bryobacterales bacterium]|nr:GntR family transcriptional regulator [Bryobacterales bacterium]